MNATRQSKTALALGLALDAQLLPHERLDVFRVAIQLVELVKSLGSLRGNAGALDQLRRASTSVAVNIGEACGKSGPDRRRYFAIARGSALESAAALRVLLALGLVKTEHYAEGRSLCERLYAMLTRLSRSR
jgi:four helix bundle protein